MPLVPVTRGCSRAIETARLRGKDGIRDESKAPFVFLCMLRRGLRSLLANLQQHMLEIWLLERWFVASGVDTGPILT